MVAKQPVIRSTLSVLDAVALIVGLVIGAGIFETPSLVAANASSAGEALLIWFWAVAYL